MTSFRQVEVNRRNARNSTGPIATQEGKQRSRCNLWRLRRATTMETGLFEIQANF
jgi:hypothetical protein